MLQYADDITLITHSVEDLKLLLGHGNHGLYLNLKKTKIMSNTDLDSFTLDGEGVEVVDSFICVSGPNNSQGWRKQSRSKKATLPWPSCHDQAYINHEKP